MTTPNEATPPTARAASGTASDERVAQIAARLAETGPSERWHLQHRHCYDSDKAPASGIDESCGLGWDWKDRDAFDEPMRGVFSRGADAAFVHHAHADLAWLLARVGEVSRDSRQAATAEWVRTTFGAERMAPDERGTRLLEEAVELAQSVGVSQEVAARTVAYVYAQPAGEPAQEAGGVGITLLALCEALAVSADDAEAAELARVLAKSAAHFRARQQVKHDAGLTPEVA